jgi:hypothetical protein
LPIALAKSSEKMSKRIELRTKNVKEYCLKRWARGWGEAIRRHLGFFIYG